MGQSKWAQNGLFNCSGMRLWFDCLTHEKSACLCSILAAMLDFCFFKRPMADGRESKRFTIRDCGPCI